MNLEATQIWFLKPKSTTHCLTQVTLLNHLSPLVRSLRNEGNNTDLEDFCEGKIYVQSAIHSLLHRVAA